MLMTLQEAQKIKPDITKEDLEGIETAIRNLTNNKFQNRAIRYRNFKVAYNALFFKHDIKYLRAGDTIEISDTGVNDGLYVIKYIGADNITLDTELLFEGEFSSGFITKIEYPADILRGVKKLLAYDVKMGDKVGIKSESISRMSITYYDVNASENVEGYPAALLSFLNKYKKLRW
ncbi:hypothetical protein COC69_05755 [Bacillus cereus]|uniref:Uncharacterized protein n=1 Tax=Bacillus cereus TaxID=1396 RepID=A0A9X7CR50_BACCE|nr:hypothetical protein [Bacillus cereus]PGS81635.1 hypothetical protein COC69_05755 [Bacillus cereus]